MLDVGYNKSLIIDSIKICLEDKDFRKICFDTDNPYYMGNAGTKIAEVLAKVNLDRKLIRKQMNLRGETKDGWFR